MKIFARHVCRIYSRSKNSIVPRMGTLGRPTRQAIFEEIGTVRNSFLCYRCAAVALEKIIEKNIGLYMPHNAIHHILESLSISKNVLLILQITIKWYGQPASVLTDHGTQFYIAESAEKGTTEFVKFLINSDTHHIFSLKSKSSLNERGKASLLDLKFATCYMLVCFHLIASNSLT